MFFKDVITMYIAVQFRLMVLSFVIFMSFLVINQDLFVPEKSGNILLVNFFFYQHLKRTLEELY